jgi:2,4-diketo-3-deoxy-L-fuconate hydrolase
MRLVSYGDAGAERPGILVDEAIVPLDRAAPDAPASARALIAAGLGDLAPAVAAYAGPRIPLSEVRLGPPVPDAGKIICIGLNYQDHAAEQDKPWPAEPLLFSKTANALAGPRDPIRHPAGEVFLDYEVELAVVIGRRARGVAAADALAHVAGCMVGNDVSARRWQRGDGQWYRGKSCDTFYPCGPALVTLDELPPLEGLRLTTTVAAEILQDACAGLMIHGVPALIAYISRDITLEPGDIISTGTPAGVGAFRKPPRPLAVGEVVECAISGLGSLVNRVERAP